MAAVVLIPIVTPSCWQTEYPVIAIVVSALSIAALSAMKAVDCDIPLPKSPGTIKNALKLFVLPLHRVKSSIKPT